MVHRIGGLHIAEHLQTLARVYYTYRLCTVARLYALARALLALGTA